MTLASRTKESESRGLPLIEDQKMQAPFKATHESFLEVRKYDSSGDESTRGATRGFIYYKHLMRIRSRGKIKVALPFHITE